MKKINKKIFAVYAVGILALLLLIAGTTYALFAFSATGDSLSTINAGAITFHYKEIDGKGHGISITDAFPVESNSEAMTSNENVFNFKITGSTTLVDVHYEVTARMNDGSDIAMGNIVDIYLTEVDGSGNETPLNGGMTQFNRLPQANNVSESDHIEKLIYTDTIYKGNDNYEKNFKLRMWVDEVVETSVLDRIIIIKHLVLLLMLIQLMKKMTEVK